MASEFSYLFKYIIIGDTAVGKSSILAQFMSGLFKEQHEITVGVEFGSKVIDIDGQGVKLQVWDTAGQEDFLSITRSYYRSTAGALLVYDVSRRQTFLNLQKWIEETKQNGSKCMTVILIGNKSDVQEREVSYEEGKEFAEEHGLLFLETSAKNNSQINEAFVLTAQKIIKKIQTKELNPLNANNGVKLGPKLLQEAQNEKNEQNQTHQLGVSKNSEQQQQQQGGMCC